MGYGVDIEDKYHGVIVFVFINGRSNLLGGLDDLWRPTASVCVVLELGLTFRNVVIDEDLA